MRRWKRNKRRRSEQTRMILKRKAAVEKGEDRVIENRQESTGLKSRNRKEGSSGKELRTGHSEIWLAVKDGKGRWPDSKTRDCGGRSRCRAAGPGTTTMLVCILG